MKAAELFIKCLENEGVSHVFGVPGEENLDVMDAFHDSSITFITTRHEQGAAFMADVYGRLTGKAGVCLSTLGPGATNLVTGVADANMDRAPLVAIAGQAATTRMHKESHQVLDLENLFQPITKYSTQIREPDIIPEVISKAFKVAESDKSGCCFVEFPENIAAENLPHKEPLPVRRHRLPLPHPDRVRLAVELLAKARFPMVMAGNGVIRNRCADALTRFADKLKIPVSTTFMAKGAIPADHDLCLGTVGLQADDYISCGFDRADVVLCVGYDMVEYHPHLWNKNKDKTIIHIDTTPAEVDEHYIVETGLIGDIGAALEQLTEQAKPHEQPSVGQLRQMIRQELLDYSRDTALPIKPQKILWDLRQALAPEDIIICDVGAHKMWMARLYEALRPNTCIISNGFAAMGIAVPGAIGAKIAHPQQAVVAVTGDAGFMMNSQELETAMRYNIPVVVLIWNDASYGLIEWKQMKEFGRKSHVTFNNPDFLAYARSFGAKAYRIEQGQDLEPTLKQAVADNTVVVIDCPVDYRENMKLTEKLGDLVCPI